MSKKGLDLMLMEIHPDHPVGTGSHHEIRDEFRADSHTGLVFTILAPIAEIGDDRRHPSSGSALRGIDQEQQLHDRVRRSDRRLNDEHVSPTGVTLDAHEDFAIGKISDRSRIRVLPEDLSDFGRQRRVGPPAKEQKRTCAKRVVHGSQLAGC